MLESFGARLRRRREEQQIALTTIAEQTKIKASLLEALERDDVSHWPSGIFRRAFIRAYAQSVGLNPDTVVVEFLELYPDPHEGIATLVPVESSADGAAANGGPPTRLRYLMGSAIESLSRLRRIPPVEDPVASGSVTGSLQTSSEATLPPPAPLVEPRPIEPSPIEPSPIERTSAVKADRGPVSDPATFEIDLMAAANLCTEFARVETTEQVQPLLEEAARILDASGLIVWIWDDLAGELRPALAHGYSEKVVAKLPTVRADADNLTAAAFRSAKTCTVKGNDHASSALVVPLLTPTGCSGVLAMELHGSEPTSVVHAVATIFAAQLTQLTGGARTPAIRPRAEVAAPVARTMKVERFGGSLRR